MDFDQMKSLWDGQQEQLDRSIQLNEQILRKINFEKAQKELRKPMQSEVITSGLSVLFVIYMLTLSVLLFEQFRFSVPGLLSAGATVFLIAMAFQRILLMRNVSDTTQSVVQVQQDLFQVELRRTRFGMIELAAGVVAVLGMWPIVLYTGFEIDIYQVLPAYLLAILVVAVVAIPVVVWYERNYRSGLRSTRLALEEIEELDDKRARS